MKSKRYFTSTYKSHLRNTAIEPKTFEEAKTMAFEAAKEGIACGFSAEWADKYVNHIPPGSMAWWYEDMIRAYADYLNGTKPKAELDRVISAIERKWSDTEDMLQNIFKFRKAAEEAFKKQGIQFGEVEFACPICGGQAKAARYNTPENPAHRVTVREFCSGCGMTAMN